MNWILCEDSGTPLWCLQQTRNAYKRGSTSRSSRSSSLRDSVITRRNACCSIASKTLRRPRMFLLVGQLSKPRLTKKEKTIVCKTDNSVPLVVSGLSANYGSISSSTSTLQDLSSTSPAQERSDGLARRKLVRITLKNHTTKMKRGMVIENRMNVPEIFLNGWRSSQII